MGCDIILNIELPPTKSKSHPYVASRYKLKVQSLIAEAISKNEKFYFTGEPCKHGHENPKRYLKNGHDPEHLRSAALYCEQS